MRRKKVVTASSYGELLKDPRWQRMRLEILNRDNFACCICKSTVKELHVHHKYYVKNKLPWEYPPGCLMTLCKDCHGHAGVLMERLRAALAFLHPAFLYQVKGYVDAINSMSHKTALPGDDMNEAYAQGVGDLIGLPREAVAQMLESATEAKRPFSAATMFDFKAWYGNELAIDPEDILP